MKLHDTGVYLVHGVPQSEAPAGFTQEQAKQGTIAYGILKAHNTGDSMQDLRMKFDSMTSHDITYVGIIQTARASGMKEFPLPYVMTNCHNSLCAVGGTINEDDHQFALSTAHKYGGIYVPPNMAVIHSYNREMMSGCGRMILGSDSHTRYGALGTMAVGEGGGELAKQLGGKVHMDLVGKICPDGRIYVEQGVVAGCSGGTYENICAVADIIRGKSCGNGEFKFSVYPDSMPTYLELVKNGTVADIVSAGGIFRECFCGPCFGAGDTPANGEFSIRHTTRNFPNREGSKPGEGQISAVALMDARSIAATAANGGYLTAASELTDVEYTTPDYHFDQGVYDKRVYNGWGHPEPDYELKFGPNIKDWPEQPALSDDLLVKIVSYITDPVTTTDELIPSGETSSFRSNPLRLAEFTLSRKDPAYVPNAKAVKALDNERLAGEVPDEITVVYAQVKALGYHPDAAHTNIGSAIFANKPGDGSAREQAASCQRVLGGAANFACEYATKRYRSNCINWGMLPFLLDTPNVLDNGDYVYLPGIRKALLEAADEMTAIAVKHDGGLVEFRVRLGAMTDAERQILADGCLINYYKNH